MCMYVSKICAEGIFVTFPWWLKNVKSRSNIALFSNERHFEIWFPKKRTITFFWSKLSKLHKKDQILHLANYIFPKIRGNKNKPWTHSTPLNWEFTAIFLNCIVNVTIQESLCDSSQTQGSQQAYKIHGTVGPPVPEKKNWPRRKFSKLKKKKKKKPSQKKIENVNIS